MIEIEIPGRDPLRIQNVVLDFNGTIAADGRLLNGVAEYLNGLADRLSFYVITADTFGTVKEQLENVRCELVKIPTDAQDESKWAFLKRLGSETTVCIGNGTNDRKMVKDAALGIAIMQSEGVAVDTLLAADVVCSSVLDALSFFSHPDRLRATLRN